MIGNDTPDFLFDLALTYFLAGRLDDAVATLEQIPVAAEKTIASGPMSPSLGWPNR